MSKEFLIFELIFLHTKGYPVLGAAAAGSAGKPPVTVSSPNCDSRNLKLRVSDPLSKYKGLAQRFRNGVVATASHVAATPRCRNQLATRVVAAPSCLPSPPALRLRVANCSCRAMPRVIPALWVVLWRLRCHNPGRVATTRVVTTPVVTTPFLRCA